MRSLLGCVLLARVSLARAVEKSRMMLWQLGRAGRATLAGCVATVVGVKCLSHKSGERPKPLSGVAGRPTVAVVGAGVAGCSSAYFLRRLCGDQLDLHVFEKAVIGGRTDVIEFDGHKYESGGAVMHSSNKYLADFAEQFGLPTLQAKDVPSTPAAIFNGKQFILTLGTCGICTDLKLLFRYGLSTIRFQLFLRSSLKKFSKIYDLQSNGEAFSSVPELLTAMGGTDFLDQTQVTAQDYFVGKLGWSQKMIDELFVAGLRVNYGQDSTVDAFTTMVSMAGAESGSLWNVVGGNKQIPEKALQWSNATFHHSEVLNITRVDNGNTSPPKYTVSYQDVGSSSAKSEEFDAVIFANPLPLSHVSFTGFPEPVYTPVSTAPYHRTVATFVKGELNPAFFGLNSYGKDFPFDIMTTATVPEEISFPLCSIGLLIPSEATAQTVKQYVTPVEQQPDRVWKLFSTCPLTQEELDQIFLKRGEAVAVDWRAYPQYSPPEQFPKFVLDDGVFYTNAIELAASAMEMSAVGAMNCSLLAWKYLS